MDLIIIIAFVALAMLVYNIAAVKNRQQATIEEEKHGTEHKDEMLSDEEHNPLETPFRQLTEQECTRSNTKYAKSDSESVDCENNGCELKRNASLEIDYDAKQSVGVHDVAGFQRNTVEPNDTIFGIGNIDTTTTGNTDKAEDFKMLSDDFDLQSAVLYSEILKPKFDNNQD